MIDEQRLIEEARDQMGPMRNLIAGANRALTERRKLLKDLIKAKQRIEELHLSGAGEKRIAKATERLLKISAEVDALIDAEELPGTTRHEPMPTQQATTP